MDRPEFRWRVAVGAAFPGTGADGTGSVDPRALAFYQGLGLLAFPAFVISIEGVLNLSLSIWLAPRLGLPGVALATAVPAIISVVVLPPYLCRKLKIPIRLLLDSIAPGVAMIVAIVAIQTAVAFALPSVSWLALILRSSITAPLAVAIITTMFPDEERKAIMRFVGWPKRPLAGPRGRHDEP